MSATPTSANKLKNLLKKYNLFLKDVSTSLKDPQSGYVYRFKPSEKYIYFSWDTEALIAAVEELSKLCPFIGDKQLKRALSLLMFDLFEEQILTDNNEEGNKYEIKSLADIVNTSGLEDRMYQIIEATNQLAIDFTVCIPIEGVKIEFDGLRVRNIALYSPSHPLVAEFEDDWSDIYEISASIGCYALIDVYGDTEYVCKKGIEETKEAIKILNFSLSSSLHRPEWPMINVGKQASYHPKDKKKAGIVMGSNYLYFQPENFSIELKQQAKIKWYDSLVSERSPSEITQRALRSINWYSKAVDASSLEEGFINLAIALESLLINDNEDNTRTTTGSITQKLRERVAFLLENTIPNRKRMAKLTSDLYAERSGIVHNGKTISPEKLFQLDDIVKRTIIALLLHEFKTWQAFIDWIDEKRYS